MPVVFHLKGGSTVKIMNASNFRRSPTQENMFEAVSDTNQVWGWAPGEDLDCAESTES